MNSDLRKFLFVWLLRKVTESLKSRVIIDNLISGHSESFHQCINLIIYFEFIFSVDSLFLNGFGQLLHLTLDMVITVERGIPFRVDYWISNWSHFLRAVHIKDLSSLSLLWFCDSLLCWFNFLVHFHFQISIKNSTKVCAWISLSSLYMSLFSFWGRNETFNKLLGNRLLEGINSTILIIFKLFFHIDSSLFSQDTLDLLSFLYFSKQFRKKLLLFKFYPFLFSLFSLFSLNFGFYILFPFLKFLFTHKPFSYIFTDCLFEQKF